MRLTYWGTRGSLAKPGPDTVRYGGNTSCIQVESDSGTLVVIDCGTGAHGLGIKLLERNQPLEGHLLIGHTHWDHIQGIPFFGPLYHPGHTWEVYAPQGFGKSLEDTLAGQMEYTYFPVNLDALAAEVRYHTLVEGTFEVGDIRVQARYMNHPALTLGFRLEVDGVAVVYACDHEPYAPELAVEALPIEGADREHAEFLRDADLVIHDAQYTALEYPQKTGWGHSTHEYAVAVCRAVGVKRLALTHHDPLRTDAELDRIKADLAGTLTDQGADLELLVATEGETIELRSDRQPTIEVSPSPSALRHAPEIDGQLIVLAVPDEGAATLIRKAAFADGLAVREAGSASELLDACERYQPSLVLLGDGLDPAGAEPLAASIRALDDDNASIVPIINVSNTHALAPTESGVTDRLMMPFSEPYVRTRIRAWLLRMPCRWVAPPMPEDEAERLEALRDLCMLDTPREERFDRLTRLASAALDVPIALVTLLDSERQWFKSRQGTTLSESTREVSFCGHAILSDEPMVVLDALEDDRFADNPVVSGDLRLRFYAGQPLRLPSGHRVGTLCVLDTRPREPTPAQMQALADLAHLVEQELLSAA